MQYLQAVIFEALRLFPSTGLNSTRVVPVEGAHIDGIHFPGGVISSEWDFAARLADNLLDHRGCQPMGTSKRSRRVWCRLKFFPT